MLKEFPLTQLLAIAPLTTGEAVWGDVVDFIMPWLFRSGAAVAVVGLILFALAIHSGEPDSKNKAMLTMVAGGIIAAVGGFAPNFLK
ncbi:MAG: hypothetical protein FWG91_10300 [Lachnospiraceae bacterium]|nr:hypothetical protein [Lachnospiraceae bacterium]